jgi:1-phosphatidylinositol-3-phosphate 5-kinase
MFSSPLWVDENSKSRLEAAIWNDTLFLSSLGVMDYSLLTGIDQHRSQFVVGIIGTAERSRTGAAACLTLCFLHLSDFMRQYTWDKHLETWVKSVGGREVPTVISPKQYKARFRAAMNFYFVMVPTKFSSFTMTNTNNPNPEKTAATASSASISVML